VVRRRLGECTGWWWSAHDPTLDLSWPHDSSKDGGRRAQGGHPGLSVTGAPPPFSDVSGAPRRSHFRTATGGPLNGDTFTSRVFTRILDEAGLPHVGLHVLRHSYASLLINQGETLTYVSRQLGHANVQITAGVYGHLFASTGKAAMTKLDGQLSTVRR
jgi:Phage integrase family